MKPEKQSKHLHITFHNPNKAEETCILLVKVIAENMVESLIYQTESAQG